MTTIDEIEQFSLKLANSLIKCSAEEYYKMYHDKFYDDENIEFMDYFLSLIPRRKEFCVEQTKLRTYKVLNNINTSKDVRVCLNQYDLEEGVDYLVGTFPSKILIINTVVIIKKNII